MASAGLAAAALTPAASFARVACERSVRLGVVLPRSHRFALLPQRLLAGFESYAAAPCASGAGVSLSIVPIAGDSAAATYRATAEAIEARRIDVVAGMDDRDWSVRIAPLLDANRVPCVVTDLGADVARATRQSPWIVRHSLGYWQANYAMGSWCARHLGARAVVVADFLESGYDMVYAFRRAFEAAGGSVEGVVVTGLPDGSGGFDDVERAVRGARPDFVYAFHSGHRAEAFLRFYERAGLARHARLAGAALLTDPVTAHGPLAVAEGVITVSPWSHDAECAGNLALRHACRMRDGAAPDLFAALGYETAQRIAIALAQGPAIRADGAQALASAGYAGPRGDVRPDPALREAPAPAYVQTVARAGTRLAHVTVARLAATQLAPAERQHLQTMIKSGWAHAYLSA
jgi:branched-chain amino acid transport system substrate-binding protein